MGLGIEIEKERPPDPGPEIYRSEFPSDLMARVDVMTAVCDALKARNGFVGEDESHMFRLCFDEALVNAIKHGNRFDANKKVTVTLYHAPEVWGVRIEDQGKGFDPKTLPDPDDPNSLLLEHGRGILIMKSIMSEVHYYDRGNRLLLVKRRNESAPEK